MNYLLIVVDAFDQTRIEESDNDLIPNINCFSKLGGFKFLNVYSQSPYTEAAAMALYAGQNTLDNGGYLMRFGNTGSTIFECFKNAGYETFFNAHAPQIYPTSQRRGIDNLFFSRPFDFDVLWRYRLEHYSSLLKHNQLDENDLNIVSDIIGDNFTEAKKFLLSYINNDDECELIKNYDSTFNALESLKKLEEEFERYKNNRLDYCLSVLKEGKNHLFFKVPHFAIGNYTLNDDVYKFQNNEIKKLCKKIKRANILRCLTRNEDLYKEFFKTCLASFRPHKKREIFKRFYMIKNALFMTHLSERYGTKASFLKEQPSFNAFSNHFFEWIDRRKSDKPFFACLHVDDIHFPEVFYSYDSNDLNLIKSEIELATSFLKNKDKGKTTILHDMSLKYADFHVGLILKKLEKKNLLKDTVVIVTADHGFSYSGYPIRKKDINTFYLENFKIPLFILDRRCNTEKTVSSLLSSVDIPSTICKIAGIDLPISYVGLDARIDHRDTACIEYCGGGCPDLKRREIMLATFDFRKMICFQLSLDDTFCWDKAVEVYDIEHDPKQRKNLVKKVDKGKYQKYYNIAEQRFYAIKNSYEQKE